MRVVGERDLQKLTIEDRVCNQTAGEDGHVTNDSQRLALAARDVRCRLGGALELIRIDGLDVATVVLVVVGDCK